VVVGLVIYNAGTVAALVYAAMVMGLSSGGIWPAALIHAVMLAWCLASLLRTRA
jgi:hypothetical protein